LAARHNAGGDSVHNQTCDKLTRGSRQAAAGPQSAVHQKPNAWFTPRLRACRRCGARQRL